MERVFAGALIVVIVAAVGLAGWQTFWPGGDKLEIDPNVYFRCQKCSHEYVRQIEDLTKNEQFTLGTRPLVQDCPQCNAPQAALQAARCPECDKMYMPKSHLDSRLWGKEGGNVCEHCSLDVDKYRREQAEEWRKERE